MQFQFSEEVDLSQVFMFVFADGDFDYWTSSTNGAPDGTGAPSSGGIGVSHEYTGWVSLNGITDYLLIGAQYFNNNINQVDQDDKFKIRALQVGTVAPTSEPVPESGATIGFMGIALIGLAGAARRFRKR